MLYHFGVLLKKFGEVLEKRVLWTEKVKLEVSLLSVHQVSQKLPSIPGNELCS